MCPDRAVPHVSSACCPSERQQQQQQPAAAAGEQGAPALGAPARRRLPQPARPRRGGGRSKYRLLPFLALAAPPPFSFSFLRSPLYFHLHTTVSSSH